MSTFIASVVALGLLYIAFQQWRTNRKKLNLDLFDRRFKVWDAMLKVSDRVEEQKCDDAKVIREDEMIEFGLSMSSARFLFDEELYSLMCDFLTAAAEISRTGSYSDYDEWVSLHRDRAIQLFTQKMDFRKL